MSIHESASVEKINTVLVLILMMHIDTTNFCQLVDTNIVSLQYHMYRQVVNMIMCNVVALIKIIPNNHDFCLHE